MKNIIKMLNQPNKNNVYSPISLYYALALLANVTDGNTKKEILNVLGLKDDELLNRMNDLYKKFNINQDNGRLMLNSSLWFNENFSINDDKAKEIAEATNSAIRKGKMGTSEFDKQIHRWINDNTHSLLKDSVENIKTASDGILSLISTIYLKGSWERDFDKHDTKKSIFKISDKEKVKCDFMNRCLNDDLLIGEHFKALDLRINGIATMTFVLPNEGYSLQDISNDDDLIELLNGNTKNLKREFYRINYSIPKFDVKVDDNIIEQIQSLGIKEALNTNRADFSPITSEKEVFLSDAKQATRLKIDEEGVEGASYTYLCLVTGICLDMPMEIDFKLDRPFMFSVVNETAPIFVGTIVDPTSK